MHSDPIGKLLSMTFRAHHALVDEKLRALGAGVSSGQLYLLITLYQHDGMHQHELADYYRIDKAAVARSVRKLEELGLVYKSPSSEDHRKSIVRVTAKAHSQRELFFGILEEIESRVRSRLSEEEISSFLRTGEAIRGCLTEEIDRLRGSRRGRPERQHRARG
jgi:DNA-binding MarR family transcriptional regulator